MIIEQRVAQAVAGSAPVNVTSGVRDDLKPLTSLRFVAALLVFAYHAPLLHPWASEHALGQAGVGFFFLLSGFILTYTYAPEVMRGRFDVRAFYVARIARIYPVYLASIAIAIVVDVACGSQLWDASTPLTRSVAVIAQALAIQAWLPSEQLYFGVNSPAWSISVEAFFYALFPLLIRSLSRSFTETSARTVFMAATLTWVFVTAAYSIPHTADVWSTYVFPPIRIVDFVVGMLLGLAFLRGFQLRGSATAWEVSVIAAVAAGILALPAMPVALRYSLFLMPLWAMLIAIVALRGGAVSRALSHPILERLGEMSFAFYLVHLSAITVAERVMPVPFASASALLSSLAVAWLLNSCVERPLRVWIRTAAARSTIARAAA